LRIVSNVRDLDVRYC